MFQRPLELLELNPRLHNRIVAGQTVRHDDRHVVCAGVAIHADPVEGLSRCAAQRLHQQGLEIARSVVTKASIVAMFGAIIPEPFAIAPSVIVRPPISRRMAYSLEKVSVVMIASAALCAPATFKLLGNAGDAGGDLLHREILSNHPCRGDQDLRLRNPQRSRHLAHQMPCVVQPTFAGAGIGVPAVDEHGAAEGGVLQLYAIDQHRCGLRLVHGKDAGHRRRNLRDEKSQILPDLPDAAMHAARAESGRCGNTAVDNLSIEIYLGHVCLVQI